MNPTEIKSIIGTGLQQLKGDMRLWITHNNLVVSEALPQMLESGINFYVEHTSNDKLKLMFRPKDQNEVAEIFRALEKKYAHWEESSDNGEE